MRKHKKTYLIPIAILLPAVFVLAEPRCVASSDVGTTEQTIASKRAKDVVIVLRNERGKFTGSKKGFWVVFRRVEAGGPADIQNVSMGFTILVVKFRKAPFMLSSLKLAWATIVAE